MENGQFLFITSSPTIINLKRILYFVGGYVMNQYSYISNLTMQNFISLTLLTAFFAYKKEVFWFEDKKEKNYVEQKSWTDAFYITAILFNDKERWCYLHRYPPLYTYLPRKSRRNLIKNIYLCQYLSTHKTNPFPTTSKDDATYIDTPPVYTHLPRISFLINPKGPKWNKRNSFQSKLSGISG